MVLGDVEHLEEAWSDLSHTGVPVAGGGGEDFLEPEGCVNVIQVAGMGLENWEDAVEGRRREPRPSKKLKVVQSCVCVLQDEKLLLGEVMRDELKTKKRLNDVWLWKDLLRIMVIIQSWDS